MRTEWSDLWRKLASQDLMTGEAGESRMVERWAALARRLDDPGEQRPDPVLEFVLDRIDAGTTVLDIGAGVGRWTIPLAQRARAVTAIEPVEGMWRALQDRLVSRQMENVTIVAEPWSDADVPAHDVAVAAYSMYTSPGLAAFARKMEACSRRLCGMAMRIPAPGGVIGELSETIHGEWHDSPNFVVGYNALLEAGLTPNVFVEPAAARYWTDRTMGEAAARARRHLRLADGRFDGVIMETLERRLVRTGEGYRWPDWMRAALVWWEPGRAWEALSGQALGIGP